MYSIRNDDERNIDLENDRLNGADGYVENVYNAVPSWEYNISPRVQCKDLPKKQIKEDMSKRKCININEKMKLSISNMTDLESKDKQECYDEKILNDSSTNGGDIDLNESREFEDQLQKCSQLQTPRTLDDEFKTAKRTEDYATYHQLASTTAKNSTNSFILDSNNGQQTETKYSNSGVIHGCYHHRRSIEPKNGLSQPENEKIYHNDIKMRNSSSHHFTQNHSQDQEAHFQDEVTLQNSNSPDLTEMTGMTKVRLLEKKIIEQSLLIESMHEKYEKTLQKLEMMKSNRKKKLIASLEEHNITNPEENNNVVLELRDQIMKLEKKNNETLALMDMMELSTKQTEKQLHQKIDKQELTIGNLHHRLNKEHEQNERQRKEKEKCDFLHSKIKLLEEKLVAKELEIKSLNKENEDLQVQSDALRKENQLTSSKIKHLTTENETLNREIEYFQEELHLKGSDKNDGHQTNSDNKNDFDDMIEESDPKTEVNQVDGKKHKKGMTQDEMIASLKHQICSLQQRLSEEMKFSESEMDHMNKDCMNQKKIISEQVQKINFLVSDNDDLLSKYKICIQHTDDLYGIFLKNGTDPIKNLIHPILTPDSTTENSSFQKIYSSSSFPSSVESTSVRENEDERLLECKFMKLKDSLKAILRLYESFEIKLDKKDESIQSNALKMKSMNEQINALKKGKITIEEYSSKLEVRVKDLTQDLESINLQFENSIDQRRTISAQKEKIHRLRTKNEKLVMTQNSCISGIVELCNIFNNASSEVACIQPFPIERMKSNNKAALVDHQSSKIFDLGTNGDDGGKEETDKEEFQLMKTAQNNLRALLRAHVDLQNKQNGIKKGLDPTNSVVDLVSSKTESKCLVPEVTKTSELRQQGEFRHHDCKEEMKLDRKLKQYISKEDGFVETCSAISSQTENNQRVLDEIKKEKKIVESRLKNERESHYRTKTRINELEDKLECCNHEISGHVNRIDSLKNISSDLRAKLRNADDKYERDLESAQRELEEAKVSLLESRKAITKHQEEIKHFTEEILALKNTNEQLVKESLAKGKECMKCVSLHNDIDVHRQHLKQEQDAHEQTKRSMEDVKKKLGLNRSATSTPEPKIIESRLKNERESHYRTKTRINELEDKLECCNHEISGHVNRIDSLKNISSDLRAKLRNADDKYERDLESAQRELEEAKVSLLESRKAITKHQEEIKHFTEEILALKNTNEQLVKESLAKGKECMKCVSLHNDIDVHRQHLKQEQDAHEQTKRSMEDVKKKLGLNRSATSTPEPKIDSGHLNSKEYIVTHKQSDPYEKNEADISRIAAQNENHKSTNEIVKELESLSFQINNSAMDLERVKLNYSNFKNKLELEREKSKPHLFSETFYHLSETVNSLVGQIEIHKQENAALSREIFVVKEKLQKKIIDLDEANSNAKIIKLQLQNFLKNSKEDDQSQSMERVAEKIAILESNKSIESLNKQLYLKTSKIRDLSSQLTLLKKKLQTKNETIFIETNQGHTCQSSTKRKDSEVSLLEGKLSSSQQALKKSKEESLEMRLEMCSREDILNKYEEMDMNVFHNQEKMNALEEQLHKAIIGIDKANKEIESMAKDSNTLTASKMQVCFDTKIMLLNDNIEKLKEEFDYLRGNISGQEDELSAMGKKFEATTDNLKEHEDTISSLKRELIEKNRSYELAITQMEQDMEKHINEVKDMAERKANFALESAINQDKRSHLHENNRENKLLEEKLEKEKLIVKSLRLDMKELGESNEKELNSLRRELQLAREELFEVRNEDLSGNFNFSEKNSDFCETELNHMNRKAMRSLIRSQSEQISIEKVTNTKLQKEIIGLKQTLARADEMIDANSKLCKKENWNCTYFPRTNDLNTEQFKDQTDYFGCRLENKRKSYKRTSDKKNVMNRKSKDSLQTQKSKLNCEVPSDQDDMEQLKKLRGALQQSEKECSRQKNLNSELKRDINFLNNELRKRSIQIDNNNVEVEGILDSNLNKNFDSTNEIRRLKDLLRLTNEASEQSKQTI